MTGARNMAVLLIPAILGLNACAPRERIPVEDAQVLCSHSALDRGNNPRVHVGIGMGSGSWRGGFGSVGISTEAPLGVRDPANAWRDCVIQRSGQAPTRSFHEQLGAQGT